MDYRKLLLLLGLAGASIVACGGGSSGRWGTGVDGAAQTNTGADGTVTTEETGPAVGDADGATNATSDTAATEGDAPSPAPDVIVLADAAIADALMAVPDGRVPDGKGQDPVDSGRETGTLGREAGSPDQYRAPVGPFSRALVETGTAFSPENGGTWLMADYDRDDVPDLVFIKTGVTDTGKTEVHIASASSGFRNLILQTGTTFRPETDGTWTMADYDRDGLPDLVFIKTGNADTNKVEVHIASAKSAFQTRILGTGTTYNPENNGVWMMADCDRDGLPDLVFIKTSNTDTGTVEVHVASASSGFQTRIVQTGSTFKPETGGTWLLADYDRDGRPDLVFIKTDNTDTGTVEVHIASAASQYQSRILDTGSRFRPENDGTWLMADYEHDGLPDLVFIKTGATDTGKVEVHVASAAP